MGRRSKEEKRRKTLQEAVKRSQEKNSVKIGLTFSKKLDSDIIKKLQEESSKVDYVRRLIREDLNK